MADATLQVVTRAVFVRKGKLRVDESPVLDRALQPLNIPPKVEKALLPPVEIERVLKDTDRVVAELVRKDGTTSMRVEVFVREPYQAGVQVGVLTPVPAK